jgi:hypothetical protein
MPTDTCPVKPVLEVLDGNEDCTGLEAMHVLLWQRTRLHFACPEALREAEFKGDRLINLEEEISRQLAFRLWHGYYQFQPGLE